MSTSTSSFHGRLEGKVALVTGGGSGFGRAISHAFALAGARVLVCDINETGGQETCSTSSVSNLLSFHAMNVTSRSNWASALDACISKFGKCDILVNNAGTSYINKPTLEVTDEEFDRVMDVNVKGVFLGCQEWVKRTLERNEKGDGEKGGVIINIASVGATRPRPGLVWYNASKGAVYNATKGLASEYAPSNIRVVGICPLVTSTGLFSHFTGVPDTPENREKFISNVPMGRIGEVDDITGACVFLASEEARFITGVNLEVDGGRCI